MNVALLIRIYHWSAQNFANDPGARPRFFHFWMSTNREAKPPPNGQQTDPPSYNGRYSRGSWSRLAINRCLSEIVVHWRRTSRTLWHGHETSDVQEKVSWREAGAPSVKHKTNQELLDSSQGRWFPRVSSSRSAKSSFYTCGTGVRAVASERDFRSRTLLTYFIRVSAHHACASYMFLPWR
jgi:hypothetical protein